MLYFLVFVGLAAAALALVVLDISRKIRLTHPLVMPVLLTLYMNVPLAGFTLWGLARARLGAPNFWAVLYGVVLVLFGVYLVLRLHVFPFMDGHKTSPRLKIMMGGRVIVRLATPALLWQAALLWLLRGWMALWPALYLANLVYSIVFLALLYLNGTARMFFTSRRLSVVYRVLIVCLWWVPLLNLLVLRKCCRLCWEEYDFALYKADLHAQRAESDMCQTRYPLVMVHGVLFRDLRYFNYWGRVPKELTRYGATVYYGNQEAVGTIARNAADLRAKCLEIIEETGCGKVNIIAHSKGGLDARYAVSALGLAPHVATVTTISTPHRGVKFVDGACKLPEGLYRFIAKLFDGTFRRMGDTEPDFYAATRSFATRASREFNEEVPDAPGVYYQSYAAKMRNMFSDSLLCVPYCLARAEGDNDGLVSVESAKWGDFRGVWHAPGRRGISHGDLIDLKREDIKGFDVCEAYVKVVAELKEKGY